MSLGWKMAGTSKLFPSNQLLSSLQIVSTTFFEPFIPGRDAAPEQDSRARPSPPLSGRVGLKHSRRPRAGGSEGRRCRAKDDATEDQPIVWRGVRCLGDRSPPLHRPSLALPNT